MRKRQATALLEIRHRENREAQATVGGGLEVKTLSDAGEFEGHGSVFGVEDSYGDIVAPGAFERIDVPRVIAAVEERGGIEAARGYARRYTERALREIG